VSRVLLTETPGFGGSCIQHMQGNASNFDPDCRFIHVKVHLFLWSPCLG